MLIFKKEKKARELVLGHLGDVHECLMESRDTVEAFMRGDLELARQKSAAVVALESRADLQARQVREVLLDGAFLPHIRSDVYRLVNAVDTIAGKAEDVAKFVIDQSPMVPEEVQADVLGIYGQSLNCFLELRKALRDYFKPKGKLENLHVHVARVTEIESEVDSLQSALTEKVFASSLHLGEKIHVQQLISAIGNIADLSEDAADELEFAAMKSVV